MHIKTLEVEKKEKNEVQELEDLHKQPNSTKVESIKCIDQPNPIKVESIKNVDQINCVDNIKSDSLQDGPLHRLCNDVSTNPKFNVTSNSQEVHKFVFTKEDVQRVVSIEEMYGVIIEVVDSLCTAIAQCPEQNLDNKSTPRLIVKKQDSSILTYEDLTMAFLTGSLSPTYVQIFEDADKYNVLKGISMNSMSKNLERWSNEAQHMGLGWIPINNNSIGFCVDSLQAWLVALILIHEAQCDVKLHNTVDFKFGIDTRTITNSRICEVMLELLCNPSPLSCISVAKWEGEDQQWDDFFSHIAKRTDPKNLLHQIVAICEDGLNIEDRHLDVTFIECHHMAFYCSTIYRGKVNALEEQFCPWCTTSHQSKCRITVDHIVMATDTIKNLCLTYHMRPQLLVVYFACKSAFNITNKMISNKFLKSHYNCIFF